MQREIIASLENKKIGIWGFGVTGQSILSFVGKLADKFFIFENQPLTSTQIDLAQSYNALVVNPAYLSAFLEACDVIIPSPGVDISAYKSTYGDKFISELDLFADVVEIPTIAITGSVGKTSTVFMLEQLLTKLGKRVKAIGNIGQPLLSFLAEQKNYDYAILELSSFQLEHSTQFNPTIACITNLIPNHLDRHKSMENYLQAKGNLLLHQKGETHTAILPLIDIDYWWPFITTQKVIWVGENAYDNITNSLSDVCPKNNLSLIFSILEQCSFEPEIVAPLCSELKRPEHRMEYVGTHSGIHFYNDSKSTVIEATLQALTLCKNRSTILLLGGLSKGINRKNLIEQLPSFVKRVICFGQEAEQLYHWCNEAVIESSHHATLEDAFNTAITHAQKDDIILLSPAGTSYDLFKNFEERGKKFKELVQCFSKN